MNSDTLRSEYFVVIVRPFENLDAVPEESAVYAFSLDRQVERLQGSSDIIYVGETGNLRNRILEYAGNWKRKGGTGHRICENIKRLGVPLKVLFKLGKNMNASRLDTEREILERFVREHHELPAWNRSGPKVIG